MPIQNTQYQRDRAMKAKEREAEVVRLAREGLTLEQIAERIGYADGSGARRALKRVMERVDAETVTEAKAIKRKVVRRLDHQYDKLEELAASTEDHRTKVRARAAATKACVDLATVAGVVKVGPEVVVTQNTSISAYDTSKLSPEELMQLRSLRLKMASESTTAPETAQEPKPVENAKPERTSEREP